jgi:hypothetical protein
VVNAGNKARSTTQSHSLNAADGEAWMSPEAVEKSVQALGILTILLSGTGTSISHHIDVSTSAEMLAVSAQNQHSEEGCAVLILENLSIAD